MIFVIGNLEIGVALTLAPTRPSTKWHLSCDCVVAVFAPFFRSNFLLLDNEKVCSLPKTTSIRHQTLNFSLKLKSNANAKILISSFYCFLFPYFRYSRLKFACLQFHYLAACWNEKYLKNNFLLCHQKVTFLPRYRYYDDVVFVGRVFFFFFLRLQPFIYLSV
jgi:hypothetical protein